MDTLYTIVLLVAIAMSGNTALGSTESPARRPGVYTRKNCFRITSEIARTKIYPLYPTQIGSPGRVVSGHAVFVSQRREGNLLIEISGVTGASLQGSLARDGNNLTVAHTGKPEGRRNRMSPEVAARKNAEALAKLDQRNGMVASHAIEAEANGGKKSGKNETKYTKEVLDGLRRLAEKNWDATQVLVQLTDKSGKPTGVKGSLRVFSSGWDTRLAPYPNFLKNFLKTYRGKGKWHSRLVDASLTRPLILENILHTRVERPVLDVPEGLTLPNGETIYYLVGEAKEIGAVAIPEDLPDHSVYRSVLQALFTHAFDSDLPGDYKQNGQIFYEGCNDDLVGYWERMGWQRANADAPILMPADHPGKFEKYWITRSIPETFTTWIERLASKPDFDPREAKLLRILYQGMANPSLTEKQKWVWDEYYLHGKTQAQIADEMGIDVSSVNDSLSRANLKNLRASGDLPPKSPFSLTDITFSASTPKQEQILKDAVAKIERTLPETQKQALRLAMGDWSYKRIAGTLGKGETTVATQLTEIKEALEKELASKNFVIRQRPRENPNDDLFQAIQDPKPEEPNNVSGIREALYRIPLRKSHQEILEGVSAGKTVETIAGERGTQEKFIEDSLYLVRRQIEDYLSTRHETDALPSPYDRLLKPDEKKKLEDAIRIVLPQLTERQSQAWRLYYEAEKNGAEIARIMGVDKSIGAGHLALAKAKIEAVFLGYSPYLYAALKPARKGETKTVTELREKLTTASLSRFEVLLLNQLKNDIPPRQIARTLGISEGRLQKLMSDLEEKIGEANERNPDITPWNRFLQGKIKVKLDETLGSVLGQASERKREIWNLYYEKAETDQAISKELGIPLSEVKASVEWIKAQVEEKWMPRSSQWDSALNQVLASTDEPSFSILVRALKVFPLRQLTPNEERVVSELRGRLRKRYQDLSQTSEFADSGITDRQKEIWELFYLQGQSQPQIARKLGIPSSTVSTTLDKANKKIAIGLGERAPASEFTLEDILYSANTPRKRKQLSEALALLATNLSEQQQEIWLRSLAGNSIAQIGRELKIHPSQVSLTKKKLKERIETILGDDFEIERKPR